jgi:hypothetical protein
LFIKYVRTIRLSIFLFIQAMESSWFDINWLKFISIISQLIRCWCIVRLNWFWWSDGSYLNRSGLFGATHVFDRKPFKSRFLMSINWSKHSNKWWQWRLDSQNAQFYRVVFVFDRNCEKSFIKNVRTIRLSMFLFIHAMGSFWFYRKWL